MKNSVVKAKRGTILLGDIELEGFQMPNGEYVISSAYLAKLLNMSEKSFRPNFMSKELKDKLSIAPRTVLEVEKVAVEGNNFKINAIPVSLVGLICLHFSRKGNLLAEALADAAIVESFQRRFDTAFEIQHNEEMYNKQVELRLKSLVIRRTLTDAIRDWIERNNPSATMIKFLFPNVSDKLNRHVLGSSSKKAKEVLELGKEQLLRDHLPNASLNEISFAEDFAMRLIDSENLNPVVAMSRAIEEGKVKRLGLNA